MTTRLNIQGRFVKWRNGRIVRDDVRHASAETLSEAESIAAAFVADGFAAWIYRVESGPECTPRYRLVASFRPGQPAATQPDRSSVVISRASKAVAA